jgi:beta-mannanase
MELNISIKVLCKKTHTLEDHDSSTVEVGEIGTLQKETEAFHDVFVNWSGGAWGWYKLNEIHDVAVRITPHREGCHAMMSRIYEAWKTSKDTLPIVVEKAMEKIQRDLEWSQEREEEYIRLGDCIRFVDNEEPEKTKEQKIRELRMHVFTWGTK